MTDAASTKRADLSALRIHRDDDPPPRRFGWWLLGGGVVVAAVLALLAYRALVASGALAPTVAVAPVLQERPARGADALLTANGHVVPRRTAAVSPTIPGRLVSLDVQEGDVVEAGQELARLESDDLSAEVAAAEAVLAESRASLARAVAESELAVLEARRQDELYRSGVATESVRDVAIASERTASAAVESARAAIDTASARLRLARVQFEKAVVRAPFAGVVLRKEAEVGEFVAPAVQSGQLTRGAIVTLADLADLDVSVDVSESNVHRVSVGTPAEIAVDAVPDRRYRGRVRQVLPTADREKATVEVKLVLLDPDEAVKPEMSAKATFLSGEPDPETLEAAPVITIPEGAVALGGEPAAWVLSEGTLRRRPIVLGERRSGRIVVQSGLRVGETVVLDPPITFEEGMKVKVAP